MLQSNGFYGHVQRNNMRSLTMFIGFLIAFQLVGGAVLFIPLLFLDEAHGPIYNFQGYIGRYVPVLLVLGSGYFIIRYIRYLTTVRSKLGFHLVERQTHPRLVNIVENQALAAGLPLPRIGIIESPACNAFACGLSPESAVVVATRGLVDSLDDDELAAVVAHEIAHIRNGDIRLMAAADILLQNLQMLQRLNVLRISGWKTALLAVFFFPFLILSLLSGLIVTIAFTIARVSRLLISSSREYIADAEAVRMTHNPSALISALRRIEGRSVLGGLTPGMDAMMIDGATEGAFASHPTISERVAVLTRLSGPMAHAAGPRRDTRLNAPGPTQQRTVFGRRNEISSTTATPSRSLIGRVNAGSGTNIFGLTRKIVLMLAIGFVAFTALKMHWGSKAREAFSAATIVNPYATPRDGHSEPSTLP